MWVRVSLRGRGLVRARREGSTALDSLAYADLLDAWRLLHGLLAKQLAEGGERAGRGRREPYPWHGQCVGRDDVLPPLFDIMTDLVS